MACLPPELKRMVADRASLATLLSLQLVSKDWAAACRGVGRKWVHAPIEQLYRDNMEEVRKTASPLTVTCSDEGVVFECFVPCVGTVSVTHRMDWELEMTAEGLRRKMRHAHWYAEHDLEVCVAARMLAALVAFPPPMRRALDAFVLDGFELGISGKWSDVGYNAYLFWDLSLRIRGGSVAKISRSTCARGTTAARLSRLIDEEVDWRSLVRRSQRLTTRECMEREARRRVLILHEADYDVWTYKLP